MRCDAIRGLSGKEPVQAVPAGDAPFWFTSTAKKFRAVLSVHISQVTLYGLPMRAFDVMNSDTHTQTHTQFIYQNHAKVGIEDRTVSIDYPAAISGSLSHRRKYGTTACMMIHVQIFFLVRQQQRSKQILLAALTPSTVINRQAAARKAANEENFCLGNII